MSKLWRDVIDLLDLFRRGVSFMLSWHAIFMAMMTVFAIFLVSEKASKPKQSDLEWKRALCVYDF